MLHTQYRTALEFDKQNKSKIPRRRSAVASPRPAAPRRSRLDAGGCVLRCHGGKARYGGASPTRGVTYGQ